MNKLRSRTKSTMITKSGKTGLTHLVIRSQDGMLLTHSDVMSGHADDVITQQ